MYLPPDMIGAYPGEPLDAIAEDDPVSEPVSVSVSPVVSGQATFRFNAHVTGAPLKIYNATGALVGLRREHERGHLVRAVIEGVAFSVRHNLDCARAVAGAAVEGVRVSGGGALGYAWNQTKADVLNLPVHLVAEPEAGALGAAMLAALGMGWYESLESTTAGMVRVKRTWLTRLEVEDVYDTLYRRYLALYPALKGASSD
jgi:xylulokinase